MIKVVYFDWGGVLVDGGVWFASYVENRLGCKISDMDILVTEHAKLSAGSSSLKDFEHMLKRVTGVDSLPGDFWWPEDLVRLRPQMQELCTKIRELGLLVGVLSNMSEVTAQAISQAGSYDGFHPLIISYSAGASKPNREIYDIAVEKSGVKPEEILFIDDHEENLVYPRSIGMKTILAKSQAQVASDTMRELGADKLTLVQ